MADICTKNIIDYIADLGPVIAAFIACGLAWWQGKIQKKQKDISLYNQRYKMLYLPIIRRLEELRSLYNGTTGKLPKEDEKRNAVFLKQLDYARFLIKKKDFDQILELLNCYIRTNIDYFIMKNKKNNSPQKELKLYTKYDEKLNTLYSKIIDIIASYLRIEG